jgi:hypothetical protein
MELFGEPGPPALYLRPRRGPWNERPSEDLSFDFQAQNPARARAGFLLFRGRDSAALAGHEQGTMVTRKSPPRDLAHIVNATLA